MTNPGARQGATGPSFDQSQSSGPAIAATVSVDNSGKPTLSVTAPSGYSFQKIEYVVYDGSGRRVTSQSINFRKNQAKGSYSTVVNLCWTGGDDDDDDDSGRQSSSCSQQFGSDWKIVVQATIQSSGKDCHVTTSTATATLGSGSQPPAGGAGGSSNPPGFAYAIFAQGNLTITGNGGTDSYAGTYNPKHPNANGNVGAGGNITLTGSASVMGDATAQGTITYPRSSITGTVTPHASLTMPTASICPVGGYTPASVVGTLRHGTYNQTTGVLTLTGNTTLTLSGQSQYYFSKITATGNSTLQIVPSGTQPTALFIDNTVDFTGGSLANATDEASNLTIWGCGSNTAAWSLTGNSDAYFCVYAPGHDINITGNSDIYGGLVGDDVNLTGNANVHRDENAACGTGNPQAGSDIKADLLQLDIGNGPHSIGTETILAGQAVTLDQWVTLVSGPAPGPVTCTLTISNGTSSTTLNGSVTLSGSTAACQVPYTFPATGTYTVQTSVAVGAGVTDPDLSNNTASNAIVVSAPATPGAHVVVSGLSYTDPNVGVNTATQFAPNAAGPDTVHSSDAVVYTATISASSFVGGATSVPTVTCSATDNGSPINVTWITGPTISGLTGTATCSFTYATGETDNTKSYSHTIGVSITTPSFDNTATSGTSLTGVITVPAAVPQATVTVTQVAYSDAAENISGRVLAPNGVTNADSVHSGDAAIYTATINIANLRNTSQVTSIACLVQVDAGTFSPVQSFTNVAAGTQTCTWTHTFNDPQNNNQPTPHTITFATTTGTFKNNAAPADTVLAGVINDYQRVDVQAGSFIANTVDGKLLSDTSIKQTSTMTLNLPVKNLNASVATNVTCGQLTTNVDPITYDPTSGAYIKTVKDTVPSALAPVQVSPTTFAIAPGATGNCQYTVTAPSNLGLVSVPLAAIITTSSGAPLDPVLTNNLGTGNFTIVTNGQFTSIPNPITDGSAITAVQQWDESSALYNTTNDGLGLGLLNGLIPVGASLKSQDFTVTQLALLVIPTQTTLGTFSLSGVVSTGANESIPIGSGQSPAQVLGAALTPDRVCVGATSQPLSGAPETALSFSANVCTTPTTLNGQSGYQEITVDFFQSLSQPISTLASTLIYSDTVTMKLKLNFTLTGSSTPDAVTATVKVPVAALSSDCTPASQDKNSPYTCETSFGPFKVTTP